MIFKFLINSKGHIRNRESTDLEFKQSFHFESIPFYLRSLVAMANNKGGQIIFGIKDTPHIPEGLKNDRFFNCDPKFINEKMQEYFSHDFDWHIDTLEYDGKQFGQIWVSESNNKPILCKKNNEKNKLREGAIYFRYRGETKEIAYPELYKLIEAEKEKEKKLWMEHIQNISHIGPKNAHILDSISGNVNLGNKSLLLDPTLLTKIKFIKEGAFTEKEGAPALILKGDISGLVKHDNIISSDDIYPLLTKNLVEETGLNKHQIKCLLWKLKIKGDKRYHNSIKTGKNTEVHKYNSALLDILNRYKSKIGFVESSCVEYNNAIKINRNYKKKKK